MALEALEDNLINSGAASFRDPRRRHTRDTEYKRDSSMRFADVLLEKAPKMSRLVASSSIDYLKQRESDLDTELAQLRMELHLEPTSVVPMLPPIVELKDLREEFYEAAREHPGGAPLTGSCSMLIDEGFQLPVITALENSIERWESVLSQISIALDAPDPGLASQSQSVAMFDLIAKLRDTCVDDD